VTVKTIKGWLDGADRVDELQTIGFERCPGDSLEADLKTPLPQKADIH